MVMLFCSQVLCYWANKTVSATTEMLITFVKNWCSKGYVVPEVWNSIKNLLSFALPADVDLVESAQNSMPEQETLSIERK